MPSDFSGSAEQLFEHDSQIQPRSWASSGELVLLDYETGRGQNILVFPKGGDAPRDLVQTDHDERTPHVSPNGRWLAYVSDRSGVEEVYVEPFPGGGPRVQVSAGGGNEPMWNPNGRELFYRNGPQMIAVPVTTESEFAITGERGILFENHAYAGLGTRSFYDVSGDGQHFLMVQLEQNEERDRINRRLNLVFNWFQELKRLVPTD
jgi:hypothetical protein